MAILNELRSLDLSLNAAGGANEIKLTFEMQHQEQRNWCWAAVASSVGRFFATGDWTQCTVAAQSIPRFPGHQPGAIVNCCTDGARCDLYGYLDVALSITRTLESWRGGDVSVQDLRDQLETKNAPICLRIAWFGGGAHFVTIVGYTRDAHGEEFLDIADPATGSVTTYPLTGPNAFPLAYNSGGTWTHSYFVKGSSTE